MKAKLLLAAVALVGAAGGCVNLKPVDTEIQRPPLPWSKPADPPPAAPPPPAKPGPTELPADVAANACLKTAEELERRGFDAEAAAEYERARHLNPAVGDSVSHRLAVLYDRAGDDARAAAEFDRAVKRSPNDPDVLNDLGYFHAARGNWAEAESHLQRAVRAKPAHAGAWANLGLVFVKTGRVEEGRKAFERAVPPAQAAYNVGVLLAGAGRPDEARASLRNALALDPGLARAEELLRRLDGPTARR